MSIRHIPDHSKRCPNPGRMFTFCGRLMSSSRCIDLQRDCIDDAECLACQRSDDRRTGESHWAVIRAAATRNGHVLNSRNVCRNCDENMADVLESERCRAVDAKKAATP